MGAYTQIHLRKKSDAKKANSQLKKLGAKFEIRNGVEYGYFRTEAMNFEDNRMMNEDENGLKQFVTTRRPLPLDFLEKNLFMFIGAYRVKISCPNDNERYEIEILQKWLTTDAAKLLVDYDKSENLDRLLDFKV